MNSINNTEIVPVQDYISIELGEFQLSAGIIGLIRALYNYHAIENQDFIVEEQALLLSRKFLKETDLADLYLRAMIDLLGSDTKYEHIISKEYLVKSTYDELKSSPADKAVQKKLNDLYKEFQDMLEKNSFKAGYGTLEARGFTQINSQLVQSLKKENDPDIKFQKYQELIQILKEQPVRDVLVMKELIYSKIKLFYDGVSFLIPANSKKDFKDCYAHDFVKPLDNELDAPEKKKKNRCIECGNLSAGKRSMAFLIDTTDDMARKKSHYWNMQPDAFVCPYCSFVYTFAPVGFNFTGSDAVFINNNVSLPLLYDMMQTHAAKMESSESLSEASRFYRIFTTNGIEMLQEGMSNIQVYVRMARNNSFQMTIVNNDIIDKLSKCESCGKSKGYLTRLESLKPFKIGDTYINIYDQVMENILYRRTQHNLISHQIRLNLQGNDSRNIGYILNIIKIQIICWGKDEKQVEKLKELSNKAFNFGKKIRLGITNGVTEKDKDNSLRSLVYKLENQISVNNVTGFLDTVIRLYTGYGMSIPEVFKECIDSEETFKVIGQSYILGLKCQYQGTEKDDLPTETKAE